MLRTLFTGTRRTSRPIAANREQGGALAGNSLADPTNVALDIAAEAAALSERGFYSEAYRAVCDALKLRSGHPALLRVQGSVLYDWGRFRDAVEVYRRADVGAGLDPA